MVIPSYTHSLLARIYLSATLEAVISTSSEVTSEPDPRQPVSRAGSW
jgi:hypothetical protein